VVTSSAAEFPDVVLGSRLPVLVDFFADWCGPCHLMSPVLEQVARELAGRIKVAKVDVDANAGLASQYGIQSIPTIVLIRDGREAGRLVGAHPAGALRSWLEDELEASSRTLQGETQPGE
jgi:thioredoxin